jgi:hypothetical protein
VGEYYSYHTFATGPPQVVAQNTVTLRFNTGGGPVSGEGYLETETLSWLEPCPEETFVYSLTVTSYEGTYSPDSNEFSGTLYFEEELYWYDLVFGAGDWECEAHHSSDSGSAEWRAALYDGRVDGSAALNGRSVAFLLEVQD